MKLTENNNKTEDTDKLESKKTQKQPTVTITTVNYIFHMKLNLLIHQTAKNIQKTIPPGINVTQTSTRNILVTIQEQITLTY